MIAAVEFDTLSPEAEALKQSFLRWQCRVRQMAMRDAAGRPDEAVSPLVMPKNTRQPIGRTITVMSRLASFSATKEMRHMAKSTFDPAERRDKALRFLSAGYFQKAREFSDMLTSTFQPGSVIASKLTQADGCTLLFEAYAQSFTLVCGVRRLAERHPLFEATWWHNSLFNPNLDRGTIILGFMPDWRKSNAEPAINATNIMEG